MVELYWLTSHGRRQVEPTPETVPDALGALITLGWRQVDGRVRCK